MGIAIAIYKCNACGQPAVVFELADTLEPISNGLYDIVAEQDLSYPSTYVHKDSSCRYMNEIHKIAVRGKSIIEAMGTQMPSDL